MKILIIEDEVMAQKELKRLLAKTGIDFEILACIDSIEDAIEWFSMNRSPDLMFLDIQLADGLSFEIFKHVNIESPVIFTTAFDEYAIQAFTLNSIDYLLKPIDQTALNKALEKLHNLKKQFSNHNTGLSEKQLEQILKLARLSYKNRFIIKSGEQYKFFNTTDIAYFVADNNVVFLVTFQNQRYIVDQTMEQIEQLIDPVLFFRIHRGMTVNIQSIQKVHKYFNSRLKLELKPDAGLEILVSRLKVNDFLAWMEK